MRSIGTSAQVPSWVTALQIPQSSNGNGASHALGPLKATNARENAINKDSETIDERVNLKWDTGYYGFYPTAGPMHVDPRSIHGMTANTAGPLLGPNSCVQFDEPSSQARAVIFDKLAGLYKDMRGSDDEMQDSDDEMQGSDDQTPDSDDEMPDSDEEMPDSNDEET